MADPVSPTPPPTAITPQPGPYTKKTTRTITLSPIEFKTVIEEESTHVPVILPPSGCGCGCKDKKSEAEGGGLADLVAQFGGMILQQLEALRRPPVYGEPPPSDGPQGPEEEPPTRIWVDPDNPPKL